MGTNYVESSLKRFLKRKVKVTLGLVIGFLITGSIILGAEITSGIPEEFKDRVIIGKGTEYSVDSNTKLTDSFELTISDGLLNDKVKATLFGLNGATILNSGILESNGISNSAYTKNPTVYLGENSTLINDGKINNVTLNNSTLINKGIITRELQDGQAVNAHEIRKNIVMIGKNSKLENYGEIIGGYNTIFFHETFIENNAKLTINNYGLLKSLGDSVLSGGLNGGNLTLNNSGKIIADANLFAISSGTVNVNNYGFITQRMENKGIFIAKGSTLKNYGIINVDTIKSLKSDTGKAGIENYGLLEVRGKYLTENGKITALKNTGILVTYENKIPTNIKEFDSKGVVLFDDNGTYQIVNDGDGKNGSNTVKDMSTETEMNNNTIAGADNLFINNASLTLNLGKEIKDKAITAVSQTEGNVVLDNDTDGDNVSGNKHLTLDNTTIIGYFEKDGTLLKVDGDLTLKNGSIINAVAARDEDGNILADAVAVEVNGKLTYTAGESDIYGTIKGGEKSHIIVNGEENKTNDLNEILETSGEVDLLNGDWTKGTGKITLDGTNAVVNIDKGNGNLTGYLYGDNSSVKTTLDGMIEGNGTLNVNKIKFDMGNLQIDSLSDIYTVDGNGDVTLEGVSNNQDVLNKIEISGIFNKKLTAEGDIVLSFKSAAEMGIHNEEDAAKYEELIKNFKDDKEKYDIINKGDAYEIRKYLGVIDAVMELLGTTGVKITRDLTGAFTSAVNEWGKKADKGEWLTNAKYIGSDMEYDGTETINGYDSDINSMIGMAEYGITENTSLGFAVGGGDTKIDLKHSEKKSTSFDGNNYYAGVYAKHSVNGFDMVGSLGYTVSDLDVDNGGSADSTAFTLGGYIKKDVKLSDTIKLQPNLSFTYDYVMQDTAEMGEGMTIDDGDYHIFEGGAGVNLVKEFAFEKGNLELSAGIKYVMTNIERNKDVTGKFYDAEVNLGDPDIDDKKGTAHIGFDFEHTTGFGVNGKYETMWSDSGDDSRITAGISYRF